MTKGNPTTQIDISKDYHELSRSEVEAVLDEADRRKYRKPKNASGSRGRYFFQKLQREAAGGGRKPKRNGRSYARKGVSIGVPRYGFTPKVGDKFYVSGKLVTIKRKDGDGMLWFNGDVDGTVAMSESNLYQAAYVPEDSPFAPYEYRIKKNPTPVRLKVGKKTYPGMAKKVNGRVKIFVTPGVARKINPQHTGLKIVPVTKERFTRIVRPLLRSPYSLIPFALYKRTIGKGMHMLYRGSDFIKAGTKPQLKRYAKTYA